MTIVKPKNKFSAMSCLVYVVCRMALDKKRLKKFLDMFGVQLRGYRKDCGLSVAGLADLTDMDRSTVNNIENGDQNWTLGTYMELVEACEVPFEAVIEGFKSESIPESQRKAFGDLLLLYGSKYDHLRDSVLVHLDLAARDIGRLKRLEQQEITDEPSRPTSGEEGGKAQGSATNLKPKKRKPRSA